MFIVEIFLIIIVFFIIFFGLFFYIWQLIGLIRARGVPCVSSFDKDLELMSKWLDLKKWNKIIDLGSSHWKALRFFLNNFDIKYWIGYEANPFEVFWWKIINFLKWYSNRIFLKNKNIKKAFLKDADYIYLYLFPKAMNGLEKRIFDSIGEKTTIIVNAFPFKNKKAFKVLKTDDGKDKIYLYSKD